MPTVASRYCASSLAVIRASSLPATRIEPLVGRSRPPIRLSSVDFPDPDFPSKATRWPLGTPSEISRRAATGADGEPKTLARPSTSTASLTSGNGLAGEAVGITVFRLQARQGGDDRPQIAQRAGQPIMVAVGPGDGLHRLGTQESALSVAPLAEHGKPDHGRQ